MGCEIRYDKSMFQNNISTRAFTLIELLVVIAIIGLLSSMMMAAISDVREKSRDARRKADLQQLSRAIEMFFDETGSYPREGCPVDTSSGCGPGDADTWVTTSGLASDHLSHNITEFIAPIPVDPINNGTYYYQYEPHCAATGGRKLGFWVRARLESTGAWYTVRNGHQGTSPCPECSHACW
jgi:prepilin-type N-terminal cleavage/methylation domain-containing protein